MCKGKSVFDGLPCAALKSIVFSSLNWLKLLTLMEHEIELKLLLPEGIDDSELTTVLSQFSANIETSEYTLFNQYFDTPDWLLSKQKMGLRVRSSERGIEQTVKTSGKSVAGLHQRPEYNVAIDSLEPNLALFDSSIWPEKVDIEELQDSVIQVFHTDFKRKTFLMRLANDTDVEIAFDQGTISTAESKDSISEIELELKRGDVKILFELAEKIAKVGPSQLGNLSKAARGYLLAKHQVAPKRRSLKAVDLTRGDSCEDAFVKGLEYSMKYWQEAEYRYMRTQKISDLVDVYTGMNLLSECLRLFSDVIHADELLDVKNALSIRLRKWAWVEQLESIKALSSKRGMFSKKLAQHDALFNYLRGLKDGTLNLSRPQFLITEKDNTILQIKLSKMLTDKPWRNEKGRFQKDIRAFAEKKLENQWYNLIDKLSEISFSESDYMAMYRRLKTALNYNVLLGQCFSASRREEFTAPWKDIFLGIKELKTLNVLQNKLQGTDVEDKSDLLSWSEVKKNNLLTVIEQSRAFASNVENFW